MAGGCRIDGPVFRIVLRVSAGAAVNLVGPMNGCRRRIGLIVDNVNVNRRWTEIVWFAGVVARV